MLLAMLDFGESRCDLEVDFAKCDDKFPPYVDLDLMSSDPFLSGVNGDDWLLKTSVVFLARGEGVRGIRPPAVRVENMPMWDLRGVDTAVAIVQYVDLGRKTNKCIDR